MIVIRNSRSSASCHAAAKSAKDVGGSKHQWNIIAISSQLETLRYSLDSIWRWRWQQWWWWEWGWDKDDISEWRCCTCKLSASQGASCLSNMSAMKMSKRNIQFASWLEVVSICHLANLTATQYDFRFLYMSFLTGHMCIALAKSNLTLSIILTISSELLIRSGEKDLLTHGTGSLHMPLTAYPSNTARPHLLFEGQPSINQRLWFLWASETSGCFYWLSQGSGGQPNLFINACLNLDCSSGMMCRVIRPPKHEISWKKEVPLQLCWIYSG